ncbi:MAG TPA: hypothetical protein PKI19_08770 [Elusimicrobiales bacterium]|nr:hypothetical protein [Elusimicrobiales bacterium]
MKRWPLAACAVILFFTAAAADLGLRSRSALRTAQRCELWVKTPALKAEYYESLYKAKLARLDAGLASGRLNKEQAAQQADLLRTERDFQLEESSAKLAWLWYKTAAGKFKSPLNPWAAQARARLPAALAAWRAELAAKKIKTEDWMTE